MKTRIAVAAACVATMVSIGSPAAALRVAPDYNFHDLCKNRGAHAMPGKQTLADLIYGDVEYVNPEQEPNRFGKRACVSQPSRKN